MTLASEFSKIKDAFSKVKNDMIFLSGQISENYDEYMRNHKNLADEVNGISERLHKVIHEVRNTHLRESIDDGTKEDISMLKQEIKFLKKEVDETHKEHNNIVKFLDDVKKNKNDIKELKEKLHSSELEIFLLKERIAEKDSEIKHVKDISKHLFDIVTELSKVELDMLNLDGKKELKNSSKKK